MNHMLMPALIMLAAAILSATALAFLLFKAKKDAALASSRSDTASENLKKLATSLDDRNKELEAKFRGIQESTSKTADETENLSRELDKITKENSDLKLLVSEREKQIANLKAALKPDSFDGFFPICSNCKDIRDPKGYWHSIEEYIQGMSEADFSHSLCPECAKKLYPDLFDGEKKAITLKWSTGSDKPL